MTTTRARSAVGALSLINWLGLTGAFAALTLFVGSVALLSPAHAQEDAASCVAKCKAEYKQCIHDGSSQELCDYDSKQCQKACGGGN
ncbi:MAG TPA: hypothetical protein VME69_08220 [Methylocella sp.]|nr:hypothetical protein [Methylocella sp.]